MVIRIPYPHFQMLSLTVSPTTHAQYRPCSSCLHNYIPSIAGCLWISRNCFWIIIIAYFSHYHCMNEWMNELWYVWPGKKTDRPQPPKPTTLHTTYPSAILVNHHRIAVSIANPSEGQELVRHNLSLCLSHMNMLRFPIANILTTL